MRLVSATAASPPIPSSESFAPTPIRRGPSAFAGAGLAGTGSGSATGRLNKASAAGPTVILAALNCAAFSWAKHDAEAKLARAADNSTAGIRTGNFLNVTLRSELRHHYPAARRRARVHKCLCAAYGVLTAETNCKMRASAFQAIWRLDARFFMFRFGRRKTDNLSRYSVDWARPLVHVLRRMLN